MKDGVLVQELIMQAKSGNFDAKNKLFEQNINIIIKIASKTYNDIIKIYNVQPNFKIPDNLITKDDVIQDFCIKAYHILTKFLNLSNSYFFSSYLANGLNSYSESYIKKTVRVLTEKVEMETRHNIDTSFYKYLEMCKEEKNRKYILELLEHPSFDGYRDFIKLVLSGYDYDRLKELTGLSGRKINIKLNSFIKQFLKRKALIEQKEKDKQIFDATIKDVDTKKNLYKIYEECVLKYVNKAYDQLFDCKKGFYIVPYQQVKQDFELQFYKYFNYYVNKGYQNNFKQYLSNVFNAYVKGYVKNKLKHEALENIKHENNKTKVKKQN